MIHSQHCHFRSQCFGQVSLCLYGFTTVMWLKLSSAMFTNEDLYVISSGGQTSYTNQGGIAILVKDSLLYITIRDANQHLHWKKTDILAPKDAWFHLGIIMSVSNALKIYVNGTEVATAQSISYSPSGSTGYPMQLGKANTGSIKFGTFSIDEWYFWDLTLTAEQITEIYDKYGQGW